MPEVKLTDEEYKLIVEHRKKSERSKWRREGIEAAADYLIGLGDQACGGSGQGGQIYFDMADSILRNCK